MKKFRITRSVFSFIFISAMLLNGLSAAAASSNQALQKINRHITEDAFKGYEGREVTTLGTAGVNYAIVVPNKDEDILIGFDPRMTGNDSFYNSLYDIGAGWRFKMPYIEHSGEGNFLHPGRDGYKLEIHSIPDSNQYTIDNYPGKYALSQHNIDGETFYLWEKPYGHQEYFSLDGKIVKMVDTFGNITEYFYEESVISAIVYPDGSSVYFERDDYTVSVEYIMDDETETVATLYLEEYSENVKILSSIETPYGNNIQFEYEELKDSDSLLLSSYSIDDRAYGKYSRVYKYEVDSSRLEEIITINDDGYTTNQRYFYNSDGRLKHLTETNFADFDYTYTQNEDGSLTVETIQSGIGETYISSRTLNKYAQLTWYISNLGVLELKYDENNSIAVERENDFVITSTYTEHGLTQTASFSTGIKRFYEYYPDGSKKKETADRTQEKPRKFTGIEEIHYLQNGEIEKWVIDGRTYYDMYSYPFEDTEPGSWYYGSANYAFHNGFMNGTATGIFDPYGAMTRAMLVTILYRHEGEPDITTENTFSDIEEGQWYTNAVIWASENGISEGYDSDIFGTDDNITREQLAALLMRYAEYRECDVSNTTDLEAYTDAGEISPWALDAVKWANIEEIITGRTDTELSPKDITTRAEVAVVLVRFFELYMRRQAEIV